MLSQASPRAAAHRHEASVLEILESVAELARTTVLARHPAPEDFVPPNPDKPFIISRLLLDRLDELRCLIAWYMAALAHPDENDDVSF